METQVNLPVVLVNREGLYALIAVLGVSILGCACVLAYSFSNYIVLKKNAEEVRHYISSRAKLATQDDASKPHAVAGIKIEDGRNVSKELAALLPRMAGPRGFLALGSNESYAIMLRQELGEDNPIQRENGILSRFLPASIEGAAFNDRMNASVVADAA